MRELTLPTVKVLDDGPLGYVLINQADFDKKKHKVWTPEGAAARRAVLMKKQAEEAAAAAKDAADDAKNAAAIAAAAEVKDPYQQ